MNKTKRIATFLLALALVFMAGGELIFSAFALKASAEGTVQSYDDTSVYDDLAGYDLSIYPENSSGECEVISFMEYCFSEVSAFSSYYGLYVYIYNPTKKPIYDDLEQNKVNISFSSDLDSQGDFFNVSLKYLNKTSDNLFYKFKLEDSSLFYMALDYASLHEGVRHYQVIDFQIKHSDGISTSDVSNIYEFSGYAAYCGPDQSNVSSLVCKVSGAQSIHLKVYDTNYRAKDNDGGYLYDDIQSVYFSIPNEYKAQWGNVNKISAEWYQYKTAPMFITTDMKAYSALYEARGRELSDSGYFLDEYPSDFIDPISPEDYLYWRVLWEAELTSYDSLGLNVGYFYHKNYNGYVTKDHSSPLHSHWLTTETGLKSSKYSRIDWIFPIIDEIESLDDYRVSSEEVKQYIKNYISAFPTVETIHGNYPISLFERYEGDGFKSNTFTVEDFKKFIDKNDDQSRWESFWGINNTKERKYSPITTISQGDLYLDVNTFSEKYLINKQDFEKIINFAKSSFDNGETPYLLRFAQTDYYASPARFDYAEVEDYEIYDINGYVAQEYVFLDFDILSLEFVSEDGLTKTLIGVVADPIDIINGLTAPENMPVEKEDWWQKIMAALLGIGIILLIMFFWGPIKFIFDILWGCLKALIKLLFAIITLPFKLIGWIFKQK